MALPIQVRTESLRLLREQLGIEVREFDDRQRENMRKATDILRRETRKVIRDFLLIKTGRLVRATRRRIKKLGPGEYEGEIHFGGRRQKRGRQFLARFHTTGTRKMKATPFLAFALEAKIDEVSELVGSAHKVWLGTDSLRLRGRSQRFLGFR